MDLQISSGKDFPIMPQVIEMNDSEGHTEVILDDRTEIPTTVVIFDDDKDVQDIINKIQDKLSFMSRNEIKRDTNFLTSISKNKSFGCLSTVDEYFFGDCGSYFRHGYNYPLNGDIINIPAFTHDGQPIFVQYRVSNSYFFTMEPCDFPTQ